jgi:hypothetical protein
VRGIRGYWPMRDGGDVTISEDALHGLDSHWIAENHGIDPDVEVECEPVDLPAGQGTRRPSGWIARAAAAGSPHPSSGMVKPQE